MFFKPCKENMEIRGLSNFVSDKIKQVASNDIIDLIIENASIINL